MRLLVMDGNIVANVIDVDPATIPPEFAGAPEAPDGVGIGWVWDGTDYAPPAPANVTVDQVKAEAQRRILTIVPEWKQRNLTARGTVLAKKGEPNWTAAEQTEWDAGEAIWAQVEAIRAASDVLEATAPIPQDFTDNKHWP